MLTWKLRSAGVADNHKRIRGIYHHAGLGVLRRGRKRLARPGVEIPGATRRDEHRATDFMRDAPADGRPFPSRSLVDALTREAPVIALDFRLLTSPVIESRETVWRSRFSPSDHDSQLARVPEYRAGRLDSSAWRRSSVDRRNLSRTSSSRCSTADCVESATIRARSSPSNIHSAASLRRGAP